MGDGRGAIASSAGGVRYGRRALTDKSTPDRFDVDIEATGGDVKCDRDKLTLSTPE